MSANRVISASARFVLAATIAEALTAAAAFGGDRLSANCAAGGVTMPYLRFAAGAVSYALGADCLHAIRSIASLSKTKIPGVVGETTPGPTALSFCCFFSRFGHRAIELHGGMPRHLIEAALLFAGSGIRRAPTQRVLEASRRGLPPLMAFGMGHLSNLSRLLRPVFLSEKPAVAFCVALCRRTRSPATARPDGRYRLALLIMSAWPTRMPTRRAETWTTLSGWFLFSVSQSAEERCSASSGSAMRNSSTGQSSNPRVSGDLSGGTGLLRE
jgi:hypothetical protein